MTIKKKQVQDAAHHQYHRHLTRNALISLVLITIALLIGMVGYHLSESMVWVDAFMNAAMILSGMGPAATIVTTKGKIFAGFYALFSGLAFVAIVAIMLAPAIHKFFRAIRLESGREQD